MTNKILIFMIFFAAMGAIISCTKEDEILSDSTDTEVKVLDDQLDELNAEGKAIDNQLSSFHRSTGFAIMPISGWNNSDGSVCAGGFVRFYAQEGQEPYRWTVSGGEIEERGGEYVGIQVTGTSSFRVQVSDARGMSSALNGKIKNCGSSPPNDPKPPASPTFDIRIDVLSPEWSSDNVTCPKKKLELFATSGTPPFSWTIQGAKVIWKSGSSVLVETYESSEVRSLTFRVVDSRGKIGEIRGKADPSRCNSFCSNKNFKNSCLCNPCQKKCGGGERKDCPEQV